MSYHKETAMKRNIANVVHDLTPIVNHLKQKALALPQASDPKEFVELVAKIEADTVMLERYLAALHEDAEQAGLIKN